MLKNKLLLSLLAGFHVFAIHSKEAIFLKKDIKPLNLKDMRKTIPQRIKLAWKNIDGDTKDVIYDVIKTICTYTIMTHMEKGALSPKNFKLAKPEDISTTFKKIIGAQSPKNEIGRFIKYIKEPETFHNIGAKPLTGFVLHGPPGTGKTDLARATAKEAGVDFIHTTGSEFNGIWRGSGVLQVKALQKFAKEKAPCIVFIDEIDGAISKQNIPNFISADNQSTTNAFKTLLDGFVQADPKKPILFIGATNNLDCIDPAIIRDGRLTPIHVGVPNTTELAQILNSKLYDSNIKAEDNIDTQKMATLIPHGSTGATVSAIVNNAANIAIDHNKSLVDSDSLHAAITQKSS